MVIFEAVDQDSGFFLFLFKMFDSLLILFDNLIFLNQVRAFAVYLQKFAQYLVLQSIQFLGIFFKHFTPTKLKFKKKKGRPPEPPAHLPTKFVATFPVP